MEPTELKNFLWRQKIWLILFPLLGLLSALIYVRMTPLKYQGTVHIYIQRQTEQSTDSYFNYDGFYALQTSREYTDTVLGLVKSLDVLKRGREISEYVPQDNQELNRLASQIKAVKKAPQLIEISLSDPDRQKASEVVLALAQATQDRIRLLNQAGDRAFSIDLVDPEVLVLEKRPPALYLGVLGLGLGLATGVFLAVIIEYFRHS